MITPDAGIFPDKEGFQVALEGQTEYRRRMRDSKFNGIVVSIGMVFIVLSQLV